ncbi:MAG: peptidoglycan-binding domain-containing protein [bacterium]
MATKKSAKAVVSKKSKATPSSVAKSRVSGGVLSNASKKPNFKIAAILILIFTVLLGYLFVRLSRASGPATGSYTWLPKQPGFSIVVGRDGDKNGRPAVVSIDTANGASVGAEVASQIPNSKSDWCVEGFADEAFTLDQNSRVLDLRNGGKIIEAYQDNRVDMPAGAFTKCFAPQNWEKARPDGQSIRWQFIMYGKNKMYIFRIFRQNLVLNAATTNPTPAPSPANPANKTVGTSQIDTSKCTQTTISQGANDRASDGCVHVLQRRLNSKLPANQQLQEDGIFGAGTASAVKNFQLANNLKTDGIVGPATWAGLVDPNTPGQKK